MPQASFSFDVDNMHCGGCVRRVQNALSGIPGVTVEEVVVGRARGFVDTEETQIDDIAEALAKAGYPAKSVSNASSADGALRSGS